MPRKPTLGSTLVQVELPTELVEDLRAVAAANGRPYKAELVSAIGRYLEAPDRIERPPPPEKRPRGRPRKTG